MDSKTFVVKILMVKKPSDYSNLLNNTQMLYKFKCAKIITLSNFKVKNSAYYQCLTAFLMSNCILNCAIYLI